MTTLDMPASAGSALHPDAKTLQKAEKLSPVVTLYLFCMVVSIYAYVGPLYLNTLRAMLLVLVIPLGIRLMMGHFGRLIVTDALFIAFFLWSVVALAVNNPEAVVQQSGSTGAEFIGGYFVGRAYIRSRGAFLGLCRQLTLWVIFLVPFGLIEAKTGNPVIPSLINRLPVVQSVPDVNIPGRMGLNRVQNAFTHPIHYGLFCSVAFSLNFIALKDRVSTSWRWISSLLISLGCLLALSSGALLALMMQLGLIGWSIVFHKLNWRWWLLVGLLTLAYISIDLLSNRTPIRVFLSYATFSAHTAYWRSLIFEYGFQNALENPMFGIGLHDWERPSWMYGDSMDNFWLVIAVRFGFPAAGFIIVGYLYVLLKLIFRDLTADKDLWKFRQAWVLSFVGLTFTLCTVHIWSNIYSFVFFMFASGIWLIFEDPNNEPQSGNSLNVHERSERRRLPYSRFGRMEVSDKRLRDKPKAVEINSE